MSQGLTVFRSLSEALKAGWTVFDRTADGYLVRQKIGGQWQLALVDCKPERGVVPDQEC